MRRKWFGEVRAKWRENSTEEQQNQAKQRDRNGGRNAEVGRLADAAGGFFMPVGVSVWCNL